MQNPASRQEQPLYTGVIQLEGSFAERDLEILVYTKFTEQLRMGETSEDHLAQSFVENRVDEII